MLSFQSHPSIRYEHIDSKNHIIIDYYMSYNNIKAVSLFSI